MRIIAPLLSLMLAHVCFAGEDTNVVAMSGWSKAVGTYHGQSLRARLILAQEHSPAHAGPVPETELYVELQNVTRYAGPPLQIYFDPRRGLHCDLFDSSGTLQPADFDLGGMGPSPAWISLPYDSTIRLRASMFGYGAQKGDGFDLDLPGSCQRWRFGPGDTNAYFLSGSFAATPPTNFVAKDFEAERVIWNGNLEIPKMQISVK